MGRRVSPVFVMRMVEDGYDIRIVRELPGHKDMKTTQVYAHVPNRPEISVTSPLGRARAACAFASWFRSAAWRRIVFLAYEVHA